MDNYKKTLYLISRKTELDYKKDILVIKNEDNKIQIPFRNIDRIIAFNPSNISYKVLKYCYKNGINLSIFNSHNKLEFKVESKFNYLSLINQVNVFDSDENKLNFSKIIIQNKIKEQKKILDDFRKNHRNSVYEPIDFIRNYLKESIIKVKECKSIKSLRGIEGSSTRKYYSCFDDMILLQREDFKFIKRTKNPPLDEVNVLLSLFYTTLTNFISSIINSLGYNPQISFYHNANKNRDSLACDLVEPYRSPIVDKFVLNLINTRKINKDYFVKDDNKIIIKNDSLKDLFYFWEDFLQKPIFYSEYSKKLTRKSFILRSIKDYLDNFIKN